MKILHIKMYLVLSGMILVTPKIGKAMTGGPEARFKLNRQMISLLEKDTIQVPGLKNDTATGVTNQVVAEKPSGDVIKRVPIARRLPIPVPVKVNIKPVKIIRPIIKPIIKVLH